MEKAGPSKLDDVTADATPTEEQTRKIKRDDQQTEEDLSPKRRRSTSKHDQNEDAGASAGAGVDAVGVPVAPNEAEQTADIFKLDVDCLDETLDYLPIKYLATVGQTCKRLSRVAGFIFNQNYPGARVDCRSDEAKYFPQFVQNVEIYSDDDFEHFVSM